MKNQVQLITYVDRLGGQRDGADLARLKRLLCEPGSPLHGVFGGVHLLPFFHAIDGADAGFDPIDHTQVDPRLGQWADLKALTEGIDVMADVIVNHMSSESPQFLDYSEKGDASAYAGLFLTLDAVFPNGATERDLLAVYRPRPGLPLTYAQLKNGERRILWTSFTAAQIDIAVQHPQGRAYLAGILRTFAANGIRMVRLDAVGYAIKKAGSNCFMMAETFDFIAEFAAEARALDIEVLVEIHAYHQRQIEIAAKVDWVYDFALPPLVLHAFNFKTAAALKRWIAIRPTNALTVLDTHDGIGIIDIGADASDRAAHPGLVPPEELDALVERIHAVSGGQSRQATGAAASNLDLYQVNCSFFDAMGRDETAYLLARALQFFLPGVPQVYYVGLLAGHNDMDLLASSQVGRDINRHHYSQAEITSNCERPVVRRLIELIKLRNHHPAFAGGFSVEASGNDELRLRWQQAGEWAALRIDFASRDHELSFSAGNGGRERFAFS
ncbi:MULTISPECIES: sucrose phosphorylase [unclassified Roseateles]|uniref:sucrose phosphorylase n=1 Tax=unclassified Roseateles TaxID=2626991 RepID=UPI0006F6E406|nr:MULTISPECIES: sucrose phosphorylase [unclassified Roseateles]KQW42340.1 sucrose phosphorylase [Pelomonas sp. Root405]KRA68214.1 sucrose phosphorylase [Pelomonas sp. Root662]